MESHEGFVEIHDKRDPEEHRYDKGQYWSDLQIFEISFLILDKENDDAKEKCREHQDVDEVEDQFHFIEVEFSESRHGKTIQDKLSLKEGIQVINEDIVVVFDETARIIFIEDLNPWDIHVV